MKPNVPQEILDMIRSTPGITQPEEMEGHVKTLMELPKLAPKPSQYKGGVSSGVEKSGVKKATAAATPAQEVFKSKNFSPTERAVDYFIANCAHMKPAEVHKWLTSFIKHESPEVKPIEGQTQVDSNITVNLTKIDYYEGNKTPEDLMLQGKTITIESASELGKPPHVYGSEASDD